MTNAYYYFRNAQSAFIDYARNLLDMGTDENPRGLKTLEFTSQFIRLTHPTERCFFIPGRNDNIFAKIAETLWQLAGRNDIEWLSFYLPRAKDYSDDLKTWRGAYGPRIRNWNGVDQLKEVVNILNLDPSSRRSVISIFDPAQDFKQTLDVPCNNWLQFLIRGGNLHMNVTQRSCDLLWGYSGIDTFSWSVMQQMIACWTSSDIGTFNHFIGSLHVYEQHWNRLQKLVDNSFIPAYAEWKIACPKFETPLEEFDGLLFQLLEMEEHVIAGIASGVADYLSYFDEWECFDDEFFITCYQMLLIYRYHAMLHTPDIQTLAYMLNAMSPTDFRLAAVEYLTRDNQDLLTRIWLSDIERDVLARIYHRI